MTRFVACISMVVCLFIASSAHAAKLYGNDFVGIYEIDTVAQTVTGSQPANGFCQEVETASDVGRVLYGCCDSKFSIHNWASASTTFLFNLTNFPEGRNACTALELVGNTLYGSFGAIGQQTTPGVLGTIDLDTGAISAIGEMTAMGAPTGGLHMVGSTLYAVSAANEVDSGLYTVNLGTGVATFVATLTLAGSPVNSATGLAYADDKMFVILNNNSTLYSVNLVTGVLTAEFDMGVGLKSLTVWNPHTELAIEKGFIKLGTLGGEPPADIDCSESKHYGRMVLDEAGSGTLWVCAEAGWTSY